MMTENPFDHYFKKYQWHIRWVPLIAAGLLLFIEFYAAHFATQPWHYRKLVEITGAFILILIPIISYFITLSVARKTLGSKDGLLLLSKVGIRDLTYSWLNNFIKPLFLILLGLWSLCLFCTTIEYKTGINESFFTTTRNIIEYSPQLLEEWLKITPLFGLTILMGLTAMVLTKYENLLSWNIPFGIQAMIFIVVFSTSATILSKINYKLPILLTPLYLEEYSFYHEDGKAYLFLILFWAVWVIALGTLYFLSTKTNLNSYLRTADNNKKSHLVKRLKKSPFFIIGALTLLALTPSILTFFDIMEDPQDAHIITFAIYCWLIPLLITAHNFTQSLGLREWETLSLTRLNPKSILNQRLQKSLRVNLLGALTLFLATLYSGSIGEWILYPQESSSFSSLISDDSGILATATMIAILFGLFLIYFLASTAMTWIASWLYVYNNQKDHQFPFLLGTLAFFIGIIIIGESFFNNNNFNFFSPLYAALEPLFRDGHLDILYKGIFSLLAWNIMGYLGYTYAQKKSQVFKTLGSVDK